METRIIKGNIISAPEFGKLDITEKGYLIAVDGKIKGTDIVCPCCKGGVNDLTDKVNIFYMNRYLV